MPILIIKKMYMFFVYIRINAIMYNMYILHRNVSYDIYFFGRHFLFFYYHHRQCRHHKVNDVEPISDLHRRYCLFFFLANLCGQYESCIGHSLWRQVMGDVLLICSFINLFKLCITRTYNFTPIYNSLSSPIQAFSNSVDSKLSKSDLLSIQLSSTDSRYQYFMISQLIMVYFSAILKH